LELRKSQKIFSARNQLTIQLSPGAVSPRRTFLSFYFRPAWKKWHFSNNLKFTTILFRPAWTEKSDIFSNKKKFVMWVGSTVGGPSFPTQVKHCWRRLFEIWAPAQWPSRLPSEQKIVGSNPTRDSRPLDAAMLLFRTLICIACYDELVFKWIKG
jgi:hypothetical protein